MIPCHAFGIGNAGLNWPVQRKGWCEFQPHGFFFSSSRSALSWSIPQFFFSPNDVSRRTAAALSLFQPHGEMLLNLVQLMGGFVFFHSSPNPVTLLFAGEILETCGVMVSCPSKGQFSVDLPFNR